jgi:hypothetical protein
MFGLAVIVGPLLHGCGGQMDNVSPPMKPEDAPAQKGKDSMDYFRSQMAKKGGAKK